MNNHFGFCESCGGVIHAYYTQEREHKVLNGLIVETGRVRTICNYLYCDNCGRTFIVDDSFDGDWYKE